jgi:hypothetical protein
MAPVCRHLSFASPEAWAGDAPDTIAHGGAYVALCTPHRLPLVRYPTRDGAPWASKSAAHRWLPRWQHNGTLAAMQARMLGMAEKRGMIPWQYGAVDGAFSP